MSEIKWVEVPCTTNPSAATFANGVQDFPFSVSRPNAWIPRRSYFRFQITLKNAAGDQPRISDGLALADNVCGNLYSNLQFKMGGVDASSISTAPQQCSALNNRITKADAWMNSVGLSGYGDNYSYADRVARISTDGTIDNIGSSLVDDITFKLSDTPARYKTATCSVSNAGAVLLADGGIATGAIAGDSKGSPVGGVKIGDILVIGGGNVSDAGTDKGRGRRFVITVITDPTNLTVAAPFPNVDITATTDYYFIRKNTAVSDQSKNAQYFYWSPPLGIMRHSEPMPAGDFRFTFTPSASYKLAAVESYGLGTDYQLEVNDVRFYACMVRESIPEGPKVMNLVELSAQSKAISSNLTFTVPPSTFALTFFIQDISAGQSTAYPPSRFKAGRNNITGVYGDTTLTQIQCTYANITKPPSQVQASYSTNVNQLQQLYLNTYYDALMLGGDEKGEKMGEFGGVEPINSWITKGPFYNFLFRKDREARDTEVRLDLAYDTTALTSLNAVVWCVAWVSKTIAYTVAQGMITELSSRDV